MRLRFFVLIIVLLFFGLPAKADFISLIKADECETIIEVFIEDGQIKVTYEIGLLDWKYFKEIIPGDLLNEELREYIESEGKNYFYKNVFKVNADGKILIGEIVRQEVMPRKYRASLYTGVVNKNSKVSKQMLFVEIIYPLTNKPKKVVITPPLEEGMTSTKANIGFVTYHKKIPVNDLRYLSGNSTLNLDWNDPWYSRFNNINLRRHHQSSLMSFLYVDPYEVRHEVLMRVKDLEEWMDLGYELDDYIEVAELDDLKDKIAKFLVNRNIVTIDGKVGQPIIDKIHFVKWSLAGIQIQEGKERMDYSSAVIGVIFAFPHDSIAQKISIDWDMFSDKIKEIPNVATDPAGPMPYILKQDDHVLVWTNFLKQYKLPTISEVQVSSAEIPLLQIGAILFFLFGVVRLFQKRSKIKKTKLFYGSIIGLGIILFFVSFFFRPQLTSPFIQKTSFTRPEASSLISHLLKNTYRAFDFREESDIYDKLAVSNAEELLTKIYIDTRKSMVLESQGGIQVKVKNVEVMDVEEVSSDKEGISFKCKWLVTGDVGHWGHIHSRNNQYSAILNLRSKNGLWKLYDIDIIEEIRL